MHATPPPPLPADQLPTGEPPAAIPLSGRLVRLELLDAARHAPGLHAAVLGHDHLWDWLPMGPYAAESDLRAHLETLMGSPDLVYAIFAADGDAPLGLFRIMRIDPPHGVAEIGGILLSPALQRTTRATEALFLLMEHVLTTHRYRRLEWKCDALNAPSRAAALRLGFTHEGLFRQAQVVKGRNRDTTWFSIIDRDWPALRAGLSAWLSPQNFDADGVQLERLAELMPPQEDRT